MMNILKGRQACLLYLHAESYGGFFRKYARNGAAVISMDKTSHTAHATDSFTLPNGGTEGVVSGGNAQPE